MKKIPIFFLCIMNMSCLDNRPAEYEDPVELQLTDAKYLTLARSKSDLLQLNFDGDGVGIAERQFFFIKKPSKDLLPLSSEHLPITKLIKDHKKSSVILNLDGLEIGEQYGLYWSDIEKKNLKLLQLFTKHPRQKIITHNLGVLKNPSIQKHQRIFLFSMQNGVDISPVSEVILEEELAKETNILPSQTYVTFSKNILQIVLPGHSLSDTGLFKEGSRYHLRLRFLRDNFYEEEIVQNFSVLKG